MLKLFFRFGCMLSLGLAAVMSAGCSDNEPGKSSDGNPGSSYEEKPTVDETQLPFVGIWSGRGPHYTTIGTWQFFADGTYEWNVYNTYNYHYGENGTWRYNAEKGILITSSPNSWNWEILDVTEDNWIGRLLSDGDAVYTYNRNDTPQPEFSAPVVADISEKGMRLLSTVQNIGFVTDSFKFGFCYATRDDMNKPIEEYKKCYSTSKLEAQKEGQTAYGDSKPDNYQYKTEVLEKSPNNIINVTVDGLDDDECYVFYAFIEFADGTCVYSKEPGRLRYVKPREHAIYWGDIDQETLMNKGVFWVDPLFAYTHSKEIENNELQGWSGDNQASGSDISILFDSKFVWADIVKSQNSEGEPMLQTILTNKCSGVSMTFPVVSWRSWYQYPTYWLIATPKYQYHFYNQWGGYNCGYALVQSKYTPEDEFTNIPSGWSFETYDAKKLYCVHVNLAW